MELLLVPDMSSWKQQMTPSSIQSSPDFSSFCSVVPPHDCLSSAHLPCFLPRSQHNCKRKHPENLVWLEWDPWRKNHPVTLRQTCGNLEEVSQKWDEWGGFPSFIPLTVFPFSLGPFISAFFLSFFFSPLLHLQTTVLSCQVLVSEFLCSDLLRIKSTWSQIQH